jgi:hypothetical protein
MGGVAVLGGLAAIAASSSVACGTEPFGVEACKKIEKVRCESAQACGIDLKKPTHERDDDPVANVAACTRYYDDQCLHGNVVEVEPAPQDVDKCVDAIITGDCAVVRSPEIHPSCAFLRLPTKVTAVDAAAEAATSADASTD